MTNTELQTAREISDRRFAALCANGDDVRRTVAWQDALAERRQIEAFAYMSGVAK